MSAGIYSFVFGALVTLAEASEQAKTVMTLNAGVGPLMGKVLFSVAIWVASWLVLHLWWRKQDVRINEVAVAALVMIGFGILGTFPLFYGLFAIHH